MRLFNKFSRKKEIRRFFNHPLVWVNQVFLERLTAVKKDWALVVSNLVVWGFSVFAMLLSKLVTEHAWRSKTVHPPNIWITNHYWAPSFNNFAETGVLRRNWEVEYFHGIFSENVQTRSVFSFKTFCRFVGKLFIIVLKQHIIRKCSYLQMILSIKLKYAITGFNLLNILIQI